MFLFGVLAGILLAGLALRIRDDMRKEDGVLAAAKAAYARDRARRTAEYMAMGYSIHVADDRAGRDMRREAEDTEAALDGKKPAD